MCVRVRVLVSVCMHDTTRTRLSRQHVVGGNAAPPCPCENRLTPGGFLSRWAVFTRRGGSVPRRKGGRGEREAWGVHLCLCIFCAVQFSI